MKHKHGWLAIAVLSIRRSLSRVLEHVSKRPLYRTFELANAATDLRGVIR